MTEMGRRQALGAFGAVGLSALLAACGGRQDSSGRTSVPTTTGTATVQPSTSASSPATALLDRAGSCTLTPQSTEGPYYFDVDAVRSDIREDRQGAVLRLAVKVQTLEDCAPVSNAVVDLWHADADGLYSGFEQASTGRGGGRGRTDEQTYLRGTQVTDGAGVVQFVTVYPGWYPGRTVHLHAKVHLSSTELLTTQLYFDDDVTDIVHASRPYRENGARDQRNDSDGFYDPATTLTVQRDGEEYVGAITVNVART